MNALKIARKDIKNILSNRMVFISVMAVIIVSALYAFLYLKAFWDPYGSLNNMPIAVVNLDKGSVVDGKKTNHGKDLVDKLKKSTDVGWVVTNNEDADKGLDGNRYYAKFIIPNDFSDGIVSAKNSKPKLSNLKFITNEKKNFLASQISSKVETKLKEEITQTITKSYVEGTFDKLYDVKEGFTLASNGSKELSNGVNNLNGNIPTLVKGIDDLKKGSENLYTGQTKLNSATFQVSTGLEELNKKAPKLAEGTKELSLGSSDLRNGVSSAESSSVKLGEGSKRLYTSFENEVYPSVKKLQEGTNKLNNSLNSNSNNIKKLEESSKSLKSSSDKIGTSSKEITSSYGQINNGINSILENMNSSSSVIDSICLDLENSIESGEAEDINSALKKLKSLKKESESNSYKLESLKQGTEEFNSKIKEYNSGVQNYTKGVTSYVDTINSSTGEIEELSKGVNQINNGLNELEKGLSLSNKNSFGSGLKSISDNTNALSVGISKLNIGAKRLDSGVKELDGNVPLLTNGIEKLDKGVTELSKGSNDLLNGQKSFNLGIGELSDKSPELQKGVSKLNEGSKELADSLQSGKEELDKGLINTSEEMGDFVSSPFKIESSTKNKVANYGTGFAPYFIPLSLWVGSMMMFFVISLKLDNDIKASKKSKVIGKFLSFGFAGVIQAMLVGISVIALGLTPTNMFLYFIILIFISQVFLSIVYCLISLLGDVGRLLSIVLLMLQLTSCAGTFPLELLPSFFQTVNPYLPFTYCVEMLREVISSSVINYALVGKDFVVLALMMLVFLTMSVVFKSKSERIQESIEKIKNQKLNVEI